MFKGDKVIWLVFFFFCVISVVEVYSASSIMSYGDGNYMKPMLTHTSILLFSVLCMIVVVNIPCKYFKVFTVPLIGVSVITLIAVLIVGDKLNGASRQIPLIGGVGFQPSEIAKGTLILLTAQVLSSVQGIRQPGWREFKIIGWISLPIIGLILVENLSTAAMLAFVVLLLMFVGKMEKAILGKTLGIAVGCVAAVLAFVMLVGEAPAELSAKGKTMTEMADGGKREKTTVEKIFHRADTWKGRINSFVNNKDIAPEDVDLKKDGQAAHANIAIASSGIIGNGIGKSVERDFLAHAYSDYIYTIIIEETGFAGGLCVAILYLILLFRTANIANRCERAFPALLALGLSLLIAVQAVFHMGVSVGLLPVTGQPLPLVSKGGTSFLITCLYVAAILSVSRTAIVRKTPKVKENVG